MKPYWGERSIEFLCDYVDNWIKIIDMTIKITNENEDRGINVNVLKKFVLDMTLVQHALYDLTK